MTPDYIKVYEVGPRDGLQNERTPIDTPKKKRLVAGLVQAGLQHIELTSFVHPKAVPQMADADTLMADTMQTYEDKDVTFTGLVFNQIGYERAIAAGCRSMAFGVAVSETFSRENTRMTPQQALRITRELAEQAKRDGIRTRVYLMTAWVCPFEGPIDRWRTIKMAERIWEIGIDELAVADTIGYADPLAVGNLMEDLGKRLDMARLAVHLHDTQAIGLANATSALQAGVRIFDSSVGGLGGCPFAPGAAGNLATEDLVHLCAKLDIGAGVDFEKLWAIVYEMEKWVERPIGGRIRGWWESVCETKPTLSFET